VPFKRGIQEKVPFEEGEITKKRANIEEG